MINKIIESFKVFPDRNAFCIEDEFYTYEQVELKVNDLRILIEKLPKGENEKYIGVFIHNDFDSYCSCLSILLSGYGYVPLDPKHPMDRNLEIIHTSGLKHIISSEIIDSRLFSFGKSVSYIYSKEIPFAQKLIPYADVKKEDPAYIIFTSGSTGTPKGTPISHKNLNAFLDSVWNLGWKISEEDRFLQMSSMTFDMSIITFIIPLCIGACIYFVPDNQVKYLSGYKLMEDYKITFIAIVPSTLSYLRPYFAEIAFPFLRYSLVCGEAFSIEIADAWQKCVPNAQIVNIYGPTEATVFTHSFNFRSGSTENSYNNIMAIGSIVKNMEALIIDDQGNKVSPKSKGQLCISGEQLTKGYLNNNVKNIESFFIIDSNGTKKRYYKTGDIVFRNDNDCYFYVGRMDSQVKIQGHRVELGEIEKHARKFVKGEKVVAIPFKNRIGNYQIGLFVKNYGISGKEILDHLKTKLPIYMVPSNISILNKLPLNNNGKVDRNVLKKMITCSEESEK